MGIEDRFAARSFGLCAIVLLVTACSHTGSTHATQSPSTSVVRAEACSLAGLALDYYGGGGATGNDFGTIRVRDIRASACLLEGPIVVTGIGSTGHTVTQALSDPVGQGLVLTPDAPRVPPEQVAPRGETVGDLRMIAPYRDDPTSADGLCLKHEVVPVQWKLALGGQTKLVRNTSYDPRNPRNEFSSLITCRGRLGAPITVAADA